MIIFYIDVPLNWITYMSTWLTHASVRRQGQWHFLKADEKWNIYICQVKCIRNTINYNYSVSDGGSHLKHWNNHLKPNQWITVVQRHIFRIKYVLRNHSLPRVTFLIRVSLNRKMYFPLEQIQWIIYDRNQLAWIHYDWNLVLNNYFYN